MEIRLTLYTEEGLMEDWWMRNCWMEDWEWKHGGWKKEGWLARRVKWDASLSVHALGPIGSGLPATGPTLSHLGASDPGVGSVTETGIQAKFAHRYVVHSPEHLDLTTLQHGLTDSYQGCQEKLSVWHTACPLRRTRLGRVRPHADLPLGTRAGVARPP